MRYSKTLVRSVAAAAVALPVALANPTAVRSCGGGPQLNPPGSVPSDKLESAKKNDPLEDEALPGLDDDKATSAPAPVETATREGESNGKPAGFESAETDGSASGNSTRGGENGSITIGGTGGAQSPGREIGNENPAVAILRGLPPLKVKVTYDDNPNVGVTVGSDLKQKDDADGSLAAARYDYFDHIRNAVNLIQQDTDSVDADPKLLKAYDEIESFLYDICFYEKYGDDEDGYVDYLYYEGKDEEINHIVSETMNILMGLPAGDPRRIEVIRNLERALAPPLADHTRSLVNIPPLASTFARSGLVEEPELLLSDDPSLISGLGGETDATETLRRAVEKPVQGTQAADTRSARNQSR